MFNLNMKAAVLGVLVLLVASGCQTTEEIADSVATAVHCPSEGVNFSKLFNQVYVVPFREGRAQKWAEAFADDAVALHNRRPADIGNEKIASFGKMVASTFRFGQYDVEVVDTRVGCNWAISHGIFTTAFIFRETGEPAPWGPETGKFLIAWEYIDEDGWKIVADMGNTLE
ncbi:MAG: hypothetical protein P8I38_13470 [Arenicella sp.]|nr:hypothetical protein [Arenicella sp.]